MCTSMNSSDQNVSERILLLSTAERDLFSETTPYLKQYAKDALGPFITSLETTPQQNYWDHQLFWSGFLTPISWTYTLGLFEQCTSAPLKEEPLVQCIVQHVRDAIFRLPPLSHGAIAEIQSIVSQIDKVHDSIRQHLQSEELLSFIRETKRVTTQEEFEFMSTFFDLVQRDAPRGWQKILETSLAVNHQSGQTLLTQIRTLYWKRLEWERTQ